SSYIQQERAYKIEAIQEFQRVIAKLTPSGDNSIDLFLEAIVLGNFFNWRDQQHFHGLSHSKDFSEGITILFMALKNKQFDKQAFESVSVKLLNARVDAKLPKDTKLAANNFMQIVLFIPFFFYPNSYLAMKSNYLKKMMGEYNIISFKSGRHISYEEFMQIQGLGRIVMELLQDYQPKDYIDVQSFLWVVAKSLSNSENVQSFEVEEPIDDAEDDPDIQSVSSGSYTIDNIIAEGCFLERASIVKILTQLQNKKNLILQGPPGTGKTWLAKKLAYALMGQKDEDSLRAVQFHPNLSYEDFVRGWRPSGEGKLTLVDGPFLEMVTEAKKDTSIKHVIVIEEINRGNPAQIFGEMLTLLEADKRTPNEALELTYRPIEDERVYIPENLYVIGTMNIADRSLALVDLALRRRFAFCDLKPTFGEAWRNWVHSTAGIDISFLQLVEQRLISLNQEISKDRNLGPQFKIGHSYVTPPINAKVTDASTWFHGVVETEIGPLLEEYWFDDIERASKSKNALVEDI
ncbi:MAG: AAA family ATPase, partial [Parvibaculales bacterium]